MIGNHLASGIQIVPPTTVAVYVDVVNGNDLFAQRGVRERPFKTFEAALAAASEWDIIRIVASSGYAVNSTASITINKGIIVENFSEHHNSLAVAHFVNCKITISISTRRPVFFNGIIFFNTTLDDYCVDITSVSDHGAEFRNCYFLNTAASRKVIHTTGEWLTSGTTGSANTRAKVQFLNCNWAGLAYFEHGNTDYFAKKGFVLIEGTSQLGANVSLPDMEMTVAKGPVLIQNNAQCEKLNLTGGMLIARNCDFNALDGNLAIEAAGVAAKGDSVLAVENCSFVNWMRNPYTVAEAGMGQISIGANVLYSIKDTLIDPANIAVDAAAAEYHAWLASEGKATAMTNYNSMPVYGSGSLLT